jgi:hypothetical protein
LLEVGTYTMRVSIHYVDDSDESNQNRTLRKFYRFNVLAPLQNEGMSVIESENEEILVQGNVKNMTKKCLYVDSFKLVLGSDATQTLMFEENVLTTGILGKDGFIDPNMLTSAALLQPGESYAYSFLGKLLVKDLSQVPRELGHVEITWSSNMGEKGIYNTEIIAIGRPAGSLVKNAIENDSTFQFLIECTSAPKQVEIGKPFQIVLRVKNTCAVPMSIVVTRQSMDESALQVINYTKKMLDNVVNEWQEVVFDVCALGSGYHEFGQVLLKPLDANIQNFIQTSTLCKILCT